MRVLILLLPSFWLACTSGTTKPGDSNSPTGADTGGTTIDSQDSDSGTDTDTGTNVQAPDIVVSSLTVDFGYLLANAQGTQTVSIQNNGNADLTFSTTIDSGFTVDQTGGTVPAGGSTTLVLGFSNANTGSYTGNLLIASNDPDSPSITVSLTAAVDADTDGDGVPDGGDCQPFDPTIYPGNTEVWYNGVDEDCDGRDDDQDQDGFGIADDCDDLDATVNPGASEVWYDGKDQNCDGNDADQDLDGSLYPDDCDDHNANVKPGNVEIWYDGVDQNCDGIDDDQDGDGYGIATDCNDLNAAVNPGATESWYNGVDEDCDGYDDDQDHDGYGIASDCNDLDATINPGASEVWYNGVDENCDGKDDDQDGDGYGVASDCDDLNAKVYPGATEVWYNGVDENCDGNDADQDKDGSDYPSDCNDLNAKVYPGAVETCNGVDDDCNGTVDDATVGATTWYADADGDAYGNASSTVQNCTQPSGYVATAGDCDDVHASINPKATEVCDGVDNDCDGTVDLNVATATTYYPDADGDTYGSTTGALKACTQPSGYVTSSTDCDDSNAAVNPGATEVCNSIDDNCNGLVDDSASNASTWYQDADNDGFGNNLKTSKSCSQPTGYVANNSDCNDSAATTFPGAPELCDKLDNDCNGVVDDNPTNPTTWYIDADSDTYGSSSTSTTACNKPTGYVANATDCDDVHASVNPGASEVCNNVDDNCNGLVDDNPTNATTYYQDADADTYGNPSVSQTSCSTVAGYVTDKTDCDDTNAAVHPGATEIPYDGLDNDCNGLQDNTTVASVSTWTVRGTSASEKIGNEGLLVTPDANGDGDAELAIGAAGNDSAATNAGAVAFHDNGVKGSNVNFSSGYLTFTGASSGDAFGTSPVYLGDVDGDGDEDYAAGAPGRGNNDAGAVYIFDLYSSGTAQTGTRSIGSYYDGYLTGYYNGRFGASLASGDFNGDGDADLLVGANYDVYNYYGLGYAWLFDGGNSTWWSGTSTYQDADAAIYGDYTSYQYNYYYGGGTYEQFGTSMIAGDFDDDGAEDAVICTPNNNYKVGACFFVSGPDLYVNNFYGYDAITNIASAEFDGAAANDALGASQNTLAVGDLDGDGVMDLAMGLAGYDGTVSGGGAVMVMYGGTWSGTYTPTTTDALLTGDGAMGTAVAISDVTGDGTDDLLAGATSAGYGTVYLAEGGALSGSIYLPTSAYASWTGEASGDAFGGAIAGQQDLDKDGTDDFAVAAPSADVSTSTTDVGKVYVVPAY